MRTLIILSAALLTGCNGDSDTVDTAVDEPLCRDGDTQDGAVCGLNSRGIVPQTCVDGDWADAACEDPDVCTDDETMVDTCWSDRGEQDMVCATGAWEAATDCGLLAPEIASVHTDGTAGNGYSSTVAISGNGRYVVFTSSATNLADGDTNTWTDIYMRDLQEQTTTFISQGLAGEVGDFWSDTASISDDGQFIVFASRASNIVANDTNATVDVFIRDMVNNTLELVSTNADGVQGDDYSAAPKISGDGKFVAFESRATNLVADDSNNRGDIFVKELATGAVTRIGDPVDSSSTPFISQDGSTVAFARTALSRRAEEAFTMAYVHDMGAGTTTKISTSATGDDANATAKVYGLSADGGTVMYTSSATNILDTVTTTHTDVFVYDVAAGTTTIANLNHAGAEILENGNYFPSISADGGLVVFQSDDADVVSADTSWYRNLYLRDTVADTTTLLTWGHDGTAATGDSWSSAISGNGNHIVLESSAPNLVVGDENGNSDVFVYPTP